MKDYPKDVMTCSSPLKDCRHMAMFADLHSIEKVKLYKRPISLIAVLGTVVMPIKVTGCRLRTGDLPKIEHARLHVYR